MSLRVPLTRTLRLVTALAGMWLALCLFPRGANAQATGFTEPLMPRNVPGGIEFAIRAANAEAAYVCGDFNNYCNAVNGVVEDQQYAMEGPDAEGIFRKVYPLAPGEYRFKYVLAGGWTNWMHVPAAKLPVARDGHNILVVRDDGRVVPEGFPYVYPPTASRNGVEFRVYAPGFMTAYLAGSFNNWGNHREGVIQGTQAQMFTGPNNEFIRTVPLEPGVHQYMICLDGRADRWLPGSTALPIDESGMHYFTLTDRGQIAELMDMVPLPPRVTDGGVEFRMYAPTSQSVFLAGTFNEWAENDAGTVTKSEYAMLPDATGLFSKVLKLDPGNYQFKFVVNGQPGQWITVDPSDLPIVEGNSSFTLTEDGRITEREGKPDAWTASGLAAKLAMKENTTSRAMAASDAAIAATRTQAASDADYGKRLEETLASTSGKPRVLLFYHPQSAPSIEILSWLESTRGRQFMETNDVLPTDVSKQQSTARRYRVFRVPAAVLVDENGGVRQQVDYAGTREAFVEGLMGLGTGLGG